MNLRQTIIATFAYYNRGQVPSDALVEMYASDLADLNQEQVLMAYKAWRLDNHNRSHPLPAQIRALVLPSTLISPESKANEIATRIQGAIVKFGHTNAGDAEKFIGSEGWALILRQGGWYHLCAHMGTTINPSTYHAQTRDCLAANIKHGDALPVAIGAPAKNIAQLVSLKGIE